MAANCSIISTTFYKLQQASCVTVAAPLTAGAKAQVLPGRTCIDTVCRRALTADKCVIAQDHIESGLVEYIYWDADFGNTTTRCIAFCIGGKVTQNTDMVLSNPACTLRGRARSLFRESRAEHNRQCALRSVVIECALVVLRDTQALPSGSDLQALPQAFPGQAPVHR